ncbi:MAG: sigma 54-interacting transcriptional regulator, partial [Deltaproteobacteria bacterium]|nr:sigma 54-interacting transcriptional regulator [Deltaproteobacteria bacterium]
QIIDIIQKIAPGEMNVLITGESGTGKELIAHGIHNLSKRSTNTFVPVNCAALPENLFESELFGYERGAFTGAMTDGKRGRFEEAAKGTLFLDEIGAMPLSAQAKLLGVLEDRTFYRVGGEDKIEVSSRMIAATTANLEEAVEKEGFRRDLYFRINVVKIEVPPLRERPDDIIPLVEHFMAHYNYKFGKEFITISSEVKEILLKYIWPGNIRELRNTLERIILLEEGDTLLPEHLSAIYEIVEGKKPGVEFDLSRDGIDYEETIKTLIKEALKQTQGNVSKAAQNLNIPAHKLRYQIKKYGLKR